MGRFILKRLALLPFVLFGVTALLFCVLQFLSPEMRAALYVKDPRQLSSLEAVIDKYGLRKPVYVQYGVWLKQLAHGQLGYSETA
ncbi:MAG: ABC transporter permease, partial [Elusimicrobia bacterium]|nr:ABC transporter permease [Elusimicrobiota bacterium]